MLIRERCLEAALEDLRNWIDKHNICVGLLDATNTTRKRRDCVYRFVFKIRSQIH